MAVTIWVVDAFTETPFAGNSAAVCVLDEHPSVEWMQAVASEMNLAETAFVVRRDDGDYDLRWFTPTVEVALCGHATLATGHVLAVPARFHTASGMLEATPSDDGWIAMDFPAAVPTTVQAPAGLDVALGIGEPDEGISRGEILDVAEFSHGASLLVELGSAEQVRDLTPDLAAIERLGANMVVVTAASDVEGIDCVSRVFAPGAGIPEDPVTGSAHCALAPWWASRIHRADLIGEQASSRGGLVAMHIEDDRVILAGQAVTVSRVEFLVDPR